MVREFIEYRPWIRIQQFRPQIPAEVTPVGVIALGYRAPDMPSPFLKRGRKPDEEYIHRERW